MGNFIGAVSGLIRRLFYLAAWLSAFWGFTILIDTVSRAESAPQEASGAAIALGVTAIPYCFARAYDEMTRDKGH